MVEPNQKAWTASDRVSRRAGLVGLGLATRPGRAVYVPLGHETDAAQIEAEPALALLRPLLKDPCVLKLFCDEKAACTVLAGAGLADIAPSEDVALLSYALAAGKHDHDLASLATLHLGRTPIAPDP